MVCAVAGARTLVDGRWVRVRAPSLVQVVALRRFAASPVRDRGRGVEAVVGVVCSDDARHVRDALVSGRVSLCQVYSLVAQALDLLVATSDKDEAVPSAAK